VGGGGGGGGQCILRNEKISMFCNKITEQLMQTCLT
jgi:hypothetical protein